VSPIETEEPVIVVPKIAPSLLKTRRPHWIHLQKWEKLLPKKYVVASTPGTKLLVIKVDIQTMDTVEVKVGPALVDCGATGSWMSRNYIEHNQLTTCKVGWPIPVYNMDSSPNESGSITEIVDVILRFKGHLRGPHSQSPILEGKISSLDSPGSRSTTWRSTGKPKRCL